MLKYEVRKHFFRKEILFSIVFLLLFNTVHIFKNHTPTLEKDPVYVTYLEIYPELKGKEIEACIHVIEEKQEHIMELPQEDIELYSAVYDELLEEMNELLRCGEAGEERKEKSLKKAETYRNHNQYLYQLNQKIAAVYEDRNIDEFYNVNKIKELIDYKFSYVLIIFLMILGGSGIFSYEKESGAYQVIKPTRNGAHKIAGIKLIAMQLYVLILALLFAACNILSFKLCYQLDGFGQPMYAIRTYRDMPVNDSIAVFMIKDFLLGLLGLSVTAMLILVFSVLFQERKKVFGVSLIAVIGLIFYRAFVYLGIGQVINLLNPIHYFLGEKIMLYYETMPLFRMVIPDSFIVILAAAGINLLLSGLILFLYGRNFDLKFDFLFEKIKRKIGGNKNAS